MEEGFNYLAGTSLAADPPWSGIAGASLAVTGGSLTLTNLQPTTPAGNLLQLGGNGSVFAYRNISANPVPSVPGAAVYFSALVNCTLPPTNQQFIASLMEAGATSPQAPDDPVDLYMTTGAGGCRLSVTSGGSDPATAFTVLAPNTTHLIVVKYIFGTNGFASLYLDPVPGDPEPASPAAQTGAGDGGDDGGVVGAANLQVLLFQSPNSTAEGSINFDTVRVGTNWADVTPRFISVSLTGPQNQAVCSGSPAMFSVTAAGLPPFNYQWQTNGVAIAGATNDTYLLSAPGAADALNAYDVVVTNFYGAVTSRVASLTISYGVPFITNPPANQLIVPGVTNATFSVAVSPDPSLRFQWRTNGMAMPGATNASYTFINVSPTNAPNAIDVVIANPCGTITSTPPVGVVFPTIFYSVADAGAGFFSGENVIFTNISGIGYFVWSSSVLTTSVTNWTREGPMSELPLGTSGFSRYGYNVNPQLSPMYYIFAQTNTGFFTPTETLVSVTTPDFATFYVSNEVLAISADGFFQFASLPNITKQPASQTVLAGQSTSFSVTATGSGLGYLWLSNRAAIAGVSVPVLNLTNVSAANAGPYAVVVTNSSGSVTSSVATLTVVLPPAFNLSEVSPGTIQLRGNSITGLTYVVESATNLDNPVWVPVLTNVTGNAGALNFQTGTTDAPMQFYRLLFP